MNTKILIILIGVAIITGSGFAIWYSQIPRCPESCDDGNPCTQDFCSPETDYQCKHSPIIGTTEGCQGLVETCKQYQCAEGECQIVTLTDNFSPSDDLEFLKWISRPEIKNYKLTPPGEKLFKFLGWI